jgi:two-component system sensor histidine kinase DesK
VFGGEVDVGPAVGIVVACLAAIFIIGWWYGSGWWTVAITALGTVLASGLVYTVRQMGRLIGDLRATREALADAAVTQERLRIARDMHDLLGHTLSLIVVKAEAVRRLVERDPAAAAAQAADIEAVGRRALAEVREAVTGYRGVTLDAEVARAEQALAAAGIAVVLDRGRARVPAGADEVLGWVVREATTNVLRHSGAGACHIRFSVDNGHSYLQVRDDGRTASGQSAAVMGHGLQGLRERLEAVGGTLVAGPTGSGFVLTAQLPGGDS